MANSPLFHHIHFSFILTDAHKALTETNTTVKLFFVKNEDIESAMKKMPKQIPAVPGTMRIHQVITLAPGELIHRDVSCMCTTRQQFNCKCFNTQCFSFGQKVPTAVPQPASEGNPQPAIEENPQSSSEGNPQPEKEIQWGSPELVGQWCMLRYDQELYPGIILSTDETHVQVKCMHRVGPNRFFWPARDDILWYLFEDVLEIITPPKACDKAPCGDLERGVGQILNSRKWPHKLFYFDDLFCQFKMF